MSTTITIGANVITPTFIDGLETAREVGNIMHPVLGSEDVDVTYRPAKLRTGTLHMGFTSESVALAAEGYHAAGTVATVASTDRTQIVMKYAARQGGQIRLTLDDDTRAVWFLHVDFQEVT